MVGAVVRIHVVLAQRADACARAVQLVAAGEHGLDGLPRGGVAFARGRSELDRSAFARDSSHGASYMTALSVLSLTPPYQMLPIFQR